MRDVSIAVRFASGGEEHEALYENADAALRDYGIECLFNDGLITSCTIERDGKRLAGVPSTGGKYLEYKRFVQALEPYTCK